LKPTLPYVTLLIPTRFPFQGGAAMSPAETQEVKNFLLQSHPQYRELAERHHQLDDRLHELTDRHYLTTSEQFEEVTLKKRKLALKDQMELIAREYADGHIRSS
jgi:uncharacterized protein YdcH (DUF465 family)